VDTSAAAYLSAQTYAFIDHLSEAGMSLGFILLSLVGFALVLAFVHVLSKMDSERESEARRRRNGVKPFSGDTTTYFGHS
jgi:hypothetical protein